MNPDECMQWRPNSTHAPTACLNCAGAWDAHTRSHLSRMSPVPKVPVSFPLQKGDPIVTPATCGYWVPVSPSLDDPWDDLSCRNCKGFWKNHLRSQRRNEPAPTNPVVILPQGRATPVPPGQPVPRNEVEEKKPIIISHAVPTLTVKVVRVASNPFRSDGDRSPICTGIGTVEIDGEPCWVAFAGDAKPMLTLREAVAKDWSGAGVLAVIAKDSILAKTTAEQEQLRDAVYIGPTVQVEGAKPTLHKMQGVFVLYTFTAQPGGGTFSTVVYDRTDPWHKVCQWPLGTMITDVPADDLLFDGNWRRRE